MNNQQGAPEALRLRSYVERRKRAKQLDVNKVHAFDTGCDTEAELLLSDVETLLSLVEAQQPAPSAAAPVGEAPLPLLVRDIAADLGTTPIQVCTALAQLGFGGHSVNMAVTPRMAKSLRAHFAPPTPQADTEAFQNFHRLLCARFGYVHDERDWRRDQLSLVEHIARQAQPSPTPQADSAQDEPCANCGEDKGQHNGLRCASGTENTYFAPQADSQPAPDLDIAVMQLAESVGLIGPASRVHDLHAAIQRFHDLICVNATIKAAVMAADVIRGAATSVRDYPPLPMQFACSGVFPVYSADQMRAYVDADRAARAPADSVTAPAGGAPMSAAGERRLFKEQFRHLELDEVPDAWGRPQFKHSHVDAIWHGWRQRAAIALLDTPTAQAADSVLEDAARWNEVLMHIGADNLLGCAQYVLRGIKVPVNVLQGSVAQHFTKSIDAARKQGANHD